MFGMSSRVDLTPIQKVTKIVAMADNAVAGS